MGIFQFMPLKSQYLKSQHHISKARNYFKPLIMPLKISPVSRSTHTYIAGTVPLSLTCPGGDWLRNACSYSTKRCILVSSWFQPSREHL